MITILFEILKWCIGIGVTAVLAIAGIFLALAVVCLVFIGLFVLVVKLVDKL